MDEKITNNKDIKKMLNAGVLDESCLNNLCKFKNSQYIPKNTKSIIGKGKKISIIISTYNRHKYLKTCLYSIINQTYGNYEIIIIDDCSLDETEKMIKNEFYGNRIKYLKNKKNMGVGYSKKRGFKHSTGDYIIFCDDDDYFIDENYFSKIIEVFNQGYSVICANAITNYEKEDKYIFSNICETESLPNHEYLKGLFITYAKPPIECGVFKRRLLEDVGIMKMEMVNDTAIFLRYLLNIGNTYFYKKPVVIYRIHSKNISHTISYKFIIDNLEEKRKVYIEVEKNKIISDSVKWLHKQLYVSIRYYIQSDTSTYKELSRIKNWVKENIPNSLNLSIKIDVLYFLHKIKRIVK